MIAAAFNYDDVADPDLPRYGLIVAGRAGVDAKPFYQPYIDAGRVAQYVNMTDVGYRGGTFDNLFEPASAPRLSVSEYAGFNVVDLSSSAYRDQLVEAMRRCLGTYGRLHYFLDVFAERFYTNWSQMSAQQADTFKKGNTDLADRFGAVRDSENPDVFFYANGTWAAGHPALVPVVEHHATSEIAFWTGAGGYLTPSRWDPKSPGGLIIAQGTSDGNVWAKVPGVGYVACQPTYGSAPSAVVSGGVSLNTQRAGGTVPVPPPSIPPTTLAKPSVPTGFTAAAGERDGEVKIAWSANPAADQVKDYQAYSGSALVRDGMIGTSAILTGFAPGQALSLRLSARNGDVAGKGYGDWTLPVLTMAGVTPAPPPTTDPCADVRAELDAANARADQAVLDARAANAALDLANDKIAAARTALA